MAERYLIVVDMQNDFVSGALGTKEAQAIVPAVVEKVRNWPGKVIFTQDTHAEDYLSTQEGRLLPVEHCIEGTDGWRLISELEQIQAEKNWPVYKKPTFGSVELAKNLHWTHEKSPIESITLIGICTDICVVSNALTIKAFLPEVPVYVDGTRCAGTTPENHQAALRTMACCQIMQ
ncbi:MAG: cysteine hydrolase [Clostridiales bacterium]|nr:cysteine hydrolase [Clostridiales bacterium]